MLKESPTQLYGNERFEGYGIDLIAELAAMEGFNYTFIVREDGKNGEYNAATNEWEGMIGDIMKYVRYSNRKTFSCMQKRLILSRKLT